MSHDLSERPILLHLLHARNEIDVPDTNRHSGEREQRQQQRRYRQRILSNRTHHTPRPHITDQTWPHVSALLVLEPLEEELSAQTRPSCTMKKKNSLSP